MTDTFGRQTPTTRELSFETDNSLKGWVVKRKNEIITLGVSRAFYISLKLHKKLRRVLVNTLGKHPS